MGGTSGGATAHSSEVPGRVLLVEEELPTSEIKRRAVLVEEELSTRQK